MMVDGVPVIGSTAPVPEDGPESLSAAGLTLGHWEGQGDELTEARTLAEELDLNHAAEPGGLEEIGTCRRCGLLIAQDERGVWSHQPSVGEIDAAEAWIHRNPGNADGRPERSGTGAE